LLLRVVHADYVSDTGGLKRHLSFRTARATTGVIVINPGASLSGGVLDGDGRPVRDARVVLAYSNNPTDYPAAGTDAAGRFVFPDADLHAPWRRWVIEVEAAGFAPASRFVSPAPSRRFSRSGCRGAGRFPVASSIVKVGRSPRSR
jgi:hypothetical protein